MVKKGLLLDTGAYQLVWSGFQISHPIVLAYTLGYNHARVFFSQDGSHVCFSLFYCEDRGRNLPRSGERRHLRTVCEGCVSFGGEWTPEALPSPLKSLIVCELLHPRQITHLLVAKNLITPLRGA